MTNTQFPAPNNVSWWFKEAMAHDPSPTARALAGEARADVTVVGGGFTGLWTALLLKQRRPDLDIILIEARLCGSGASGMNGGKVHGYWGALSAIAANIGPDAALEAARLGTEAQDSIRDFCLSHDHDTWWKEAGHLKISASEAQDKKFDSAVAAAKELGVPDTAISLSRSELAGRIRSPVFRKGIYMPEGATVQPARLARALRKACIDHGVILHENTPMIGLEEGDPCLVKTRQGQIESKKVVLATNVALSSFASAAPHIAVFSSFAVMSEPIPDLHGKIGWQGDEGVADMRMFVHYFRKAAGNRILMGTGSGPIAYGSNHKDPQMSDDRAAAGRAVGALSRLLPGLGSPGIEKTWGGAIDVSADRLPFFKSSGTGHVHFGCGYSGHGVNATRIGGECLSSLVLGEKDKWANSVFCTRELPGFPPEPFRTVGGRMVRAAILTCEAAEDVGKRPHLAARLGAWLPRAMNLKVGMR